MRSPRQTRALLTVPTLIVGFVVPTVLGLRFAVIVTIAVVAGLMVQFGFEAVWVRRSQ
jgi:hypothetical protein